MILFMSTSLRNHLSSRDDLKPDQIPSNNRLFSLLRPEKHRAAIRAGAQILNLFKATFVKTFLHVKTLLNQET